MRVRPAGRPYLAPVGSGGDSREGVAVLRKSESHPLVATVRDVIEIVAILAAGFWAIYVFAYEQRIKPASEPPSLLVTGSLHKLSERNGLVQLGYTVTVRNNGHSEVSIIGAGFTANGMKYTVAGTPLLQHPYGGATLYERDARSASRTLVYRTIELTRFADTSYGSSFTLSPDEQVGYSDIFLVKSNQFDAMVLYGSFAYAKDRIEGGYPTKVGYNAAGAVEFASAHRDPNYDAIEVTLDRITLW